MAYSKEFMEKVLQEGITPFKYDIENMECKIIVDSIDVEYSEYSASVKYYHKGMLLYTDTVPLAKGDTISISNIECLIELNLLEAR